MNIAIIYSKSPTSVLGQKSYAYIKRTVDDVKGALDKLDHSTLVQEIGADLYEGLIGFVSNSKVDLVFNLVEHVSGINLMEAAVAAVLEEMGLKYTGSDFMTLSIGTDKAKTKSKLEQIGIATPRYVVVSTKNVPTTDILASSGIQYPVIVKPARQDASVGISSKSLCGNWGEVLLRIGQIGSIDDKIVVEEFIEGKEFYVEILGTGVRIRPLCPVEVIFDKGLEFMDYSSKYGDDKEVIARSHVEVVSDSVLIDKLTTSALAAYNVLGLRDYGRVDFRARGDNNPLVLEVNPNSSIGFTDSNDLKVILEEEEMEYEEYIEEIIESACERYGIKSD